MRTVVCKPAATGLRLADKSGPGLPCSSPMEPRGRALRVMGMGASTGSVVASHGVAATDSLRESDRTASAARKGCDDLAVQAAKRGDDGEQYGRLSEDFGDFVELNGSELDVLARGQ